MISGPFAIFASLRFHCACWSGSTSPGALRVELSRAPRSIRRRVSRLQPAETEAEEDHRRRVDGPDRAHRDELRPHGLHVEDPVGDEEELEIAENDGEPGCARVPERPVPGQGADRVEPDLDDDAEDRVGQRKEIRLGSPRIFILGSAGSILQKAMPATAKMNMISMLRPMRMRAQNPRAASMVAMKLAVMCMAMGTQSDRLAILASPRTSPKMKIVPIS